MIKGKVKGLNAEETMQGILDACVGLRSWRHLERRAKSRVAVAFGSKNADGAISLWVEVELSQRLRANSSGGQRLVHGHHESYGRFEIIKSLVWRQLDKKPRSGFIADGTLQRIRPPGQWSAVERRFILELSAGGNAIVVGLVRAFKEVWGEDITRSDLFDAFRNWKETAQNITKS